MTKSIRGTFTRPSTDSVWAMYVFFPTVVDNINYFDSLGVTTHMKGDPATDLTLVADHVFADEDSFADLKDVVYARVPAWTTAENRAEYEEYAADNGQTLVLEEVDNPDLTGYVDIHDVPRPAGL